eukprot:scaffold31518_cov56-Cyclotella_meneghiniana.AAC.6
MYIGISERVLIPMYLLRTFWIARPSTKCSGHMHAICTLISLEILYASFTQFLVRVRQVGGLLPNPNPVPIAFASRVGEDFEVWGKSPPSYRRTDDCWHTFSELRIFIVPATTKKKLGSTHQPRHTAPSTITHTLV